MKYDDIQYIYMTSHGRSIWADKNTSDIPSSRWNAGEMVGVRARQSLNFKILLIIPDRGDTAEWGARSKCSGWAELTTGFPKLMDASFLMQREGGMVTRIYSLHFTQIGPTSRCSLSLALYIWNLALRRMGRAGPGSIFSTSPPTYISNARFTHFTWFLQMVDFLLSLQTTTLNLPFWLKQPCVSLSLFGY